MRSKKKEQQAQGQDETPKQEQQRLPAPPPPHPAVSSPRPLRRCWHLQKRNLCIQGQPCACWLKGAATALKFPRCHLEFTCVCQLFRRNESRRKGSSTCSHPEETWRQAQQLLQQYPKTEANERNVSHRAVSESDEEGAR